MYSLYLQILDNYMVQSTISLFNLFLEIYHLNLAFQYLNYSITSDNDLVLPEIPVKKNPGWVGFWDLPGNIKLYGLKPNYLGNHLIFGEYPSVAQS